MLIETATARMVLLEDIAKDGHARLEVRACTRPPALPSVLPYAVERTKSVQYVVHTAVSYVFFLGVAVPNKTAFQRDGTTEPGRSRTSRGNSVWVGVLSEAIKIWWVPAQLYMDAEGWLATQARLRRRVVNVCCLTCSCFYLTCSLHRRYAGRR